MSLFENILGSNSDDLLVSLLGELLVPLFDEPLVPLFDEFLGHVFGGVGWPGANGADTASAAPLQLHCAENGKEKIWLFFQPSVLNVNLPPKRKAANPNKILKNAIRHGPDQP